MSTELPLSTVFAARVTDRIALEVLGLMKRELPARVVEPLHPSQYAPPGSIVFVTASHEVRYSSRNIRIVPAIATEGTRAHTERMRLISLHPWLVPASRIVCVNPCRFDSERGRWMNCGRENSAETMVNALRQLCGDFPQRVDPLGHLTPTQKALHRIMERRKARRDGELLGC